MFLLDEPFSNLDAALRTRMRTEVKHLHLASGTTSVFVTHDQEEAMTLSDLICVMRDGKIVQTGSPAEIYSKPRHRYVAEFVGKPKMSLLEGALTQGAEGVAFTNADTTIALGTAAELGPQGRRLARCRLRRAGRGRHRPGGRRRTRPIHLPGRRSASWSRSAPTRSSN